MENIEAKFSQIKGIGPVLAHEFVEGFKDQTTKDLVQFFTNNGFNVDEEKEAKEVNNLEQIFAGQSWCVTGTFENFQPRDKAMEEIVKRGGVEVSSVSKKTTCLLAGKNAGSKLEKARALGVKIVSEDEFMKMIGKEPDWGDLWTLTLR